MAPPEKYLLPTSAELQPLSDDKVMALVALAESESRRSSHYALSGMFCGTLSFLSCLGAFVFLVMHGHDRAAEVVLGTTVLAIVGRMLRAR